MNKLEQAARQALEALEEYRDTQMIQAPRKAITALREALAEQAEQEPVAWLYDWDHEGEIVTGWVTQGFETTKFNNGHNVRPLYAAPVRTKDLTDDEISDAIHGKGSPLRLHDYAIRDFRAVIAADRELNK